MVADGCLKSCDDDIRRPHPGSTASLHRRGTEFATLLLKPSPGTPSFRCTMIPIPDLFVDGEAEASAVKLPIRSLHQTDCHSCGPVAAWAVARAFGPPPIGYGKFYRLTRCAAGDGAELTGVGHDMFDEDVGDHWVFVYGVGWTPKHVYLGNQGLPLFSTVMWSWRQFKREWNPRGWGMVVGGRRRLEVL
jgi:hypothetical protein